MIPLDADRAILARILPMYATAGSVAAEDPTEVSHRAATLALPASYGGTGANPADAVAALAALGALAPEAVVDGAGQCAETLWALGLPPGSARERLLSALAGRVGCGVERGIADIEQVVLGAASDDCRAGVVHLPRLIPPTISVLIRDDNNMRLTHLDIAELAGADASATVGQASDRRVGRWGRNGRSLTLSGSDLRVRETLHHSLQAGDLNRLRAISVTVFTVAATGVLAGVLNRLVSDERHRAGSGSVIGQFGMARAALNGLLAAVEAGSTSDRVLGMAFLTAQAVSRTVEDLCDWALEALGGMSFSQDLPALAELALARNVLPGGFSSTGGATLLSRPPEVDGTGVAERRIHVHP